ncbi:chorismate mutase [uncultured Roseobacter sp.]|uniref:chorismate mutase n=1 Tax=uncultured Roseobacter sp. TaxID=114847 RepID=UPI00260AC495|nr:chorismate mutase [uncultured Roseobacter sp.]
MTARKPPNLCKKMQDLRVEIDAIDADLIDLLVERSRYIDRAIVIKEAEGLPARITDRVEEVVNNVATRARAQGLDPVLVETIWRGLIEWSIDREEERLGA